MDRVFGASSLGAAAGAGVALSKTFHAFSGPPPSGGVEAVPPLGEPPAPLVFLADSSARFTVPPTLSARALSYRLRVTRRASAEVVAIHFESEPLVPGAEINVPILGGEVYAGEWVAIGDDDTKSGVPTAFTSAPANALCFVPPQPVLELLIDDEDDPDSAVDLRITAPEIVPGGWQIDLLMRQGEFGAITTLATDVAAGAQLLLSELGEMVAFDHELRFSWKPRQVL